MKEVQEARRIKMLHQPSRVYYICFLYPLYHGATIVSVDSHSHSGPIHF